MEKAVEEIANAGCRHVEPAFIKGYVDFDEEAFSTVAAARLGRLVTGGGLGVHAVSAHLDLSEQGSTDALIRRIDFAANLGASVLITNSGPRGERNAICRTIEAAIPQLESNGLILALENPGHGAHNLTGTVSDAADFLRAVGSPCVRLNHDTGNVFTYSNEARQPGEDFAAAPELVVHAHLKDIRSFNGDWLFCALGAGDVDLANYWTSIAVDLPVTIELPLRLERPGRANPQRRSKPVVLNTMRRALAASLRFIETLEAA